MTAPGGGGATEGRATMSAARRLRKLSQTPYSNGKLDGSGSGWPMAARAPRRTATDQETTMTMPFGLTRKLWMSGAAAGLLALAGAPQAVAQAGSPFAAFAGSWTGGGTITTTGGTERIRCRASYAVGGGGTTLKQDLDCASDSYKVVIASNLTYEGGRVSGSWTEATRSAIGNLSGQATPDSIRGTISGPGFSAGVGVGIRGREQSLTITPQGATDIRNVTITLHKR